MFKKCFLSVLVFFFVLSVTTTADKRRYSWTYEYMTMGRGEVEFENYLTFNTPTINKISGTMSPVMQLAVEFGMTDNFDFAIYQVFSQNKTDGFRYRGFRLRGRYKIGEKDDFFIDPLVYFEYRGVPDFSKQGLEFKFILSKDIGHFNFTFNPMVEFEYEHEAEWLAAYTFGTSYMISELFGFGAEVKGSKYGHYVGPVISHGNEHFWTTLGSQFKITEILHDLPEFQIRLLLGILL
jgi:hypothetical protein